MRLEPRGTRVLFLGCQYETDARHRNFALYIKQRSVQVYDSNRAITPVGVKGLMRVVLLIQLLLFPARKFQPKTMAKDYENNLRRLTTSLSDYQGRYGYPKSWPLTLAQYELVVESEAGPLMVSPTGQFIVPASCPPSLLVNFVTDNLDQAKDLLTQYET